MQWGDEFEPPLLQEACRMLVDANAMPPVWDVVEMPPFLTIKKPDNEHGDPSILLLLEP